MVTFFRRKSPLAGLACISIDAERAYSVRIVRAAQQKPVLLACDSLNFAPDPGVADSALKKWARGIGLERIPCTTVLEANQYRLLTAEVVQIYNIVLFPPNILATIFRKSENNSFCYGRSFK